MPLYLTQVAYSQEAWKALLNAPQDRFEAIRTPIEKLGGKLMHGWMTFGDSDVICVLEMPDNVSAAAIAMAFAGGGSCRSVKTTPMITPAEGLEAMKKAAASGYRAATAGH